MRVLYYVDICMSVLPVSMDHGLSARHAISGLPHESVMILRALLLLFTPLALFSSFYYSLVRNPVSIEERFNPGESTRTRTGVHEKTGGLNFLLLAPRSLCVYLGFIHIEALVYARESTQSTIIPPSSPSFPSWTVYT